MKYTEIPVMSEVPPRSVDVSALTATLNVVVVTRDKLLRRQSVA